MIAFVQLGKAWLVQGNNFFKNTSHNYFLNLKTILMGKQLTTRLKDVFYCLGGLICF
jgi:hypothetical protein